MCAGRLLGMVGLHEGRLVRTHGGLGEWHQQSIALYKGCCLSLILRNSLQLIVPLALAFKYD
eukprot:COSAG06_NODE_28572_length_572_cov_0.568710_2_plen_61_part_01